jgi:MFS superfamily sulfate permease-like transporter
MIGFLIAVIAVSVIVIIIQIKRMAKKKREEDFDNLKRAREGAGRPVVTVRSGGNEFYTKVSGVTRQNDDGSDRQQILKRCRDGEKLDLVRDPKNPYDENAIRVCRKNGEQLGFISAETAEQLARKIDSGMKIEAEIANITGGTTDRPTLGCNLKIIFAE